MQRIAIAMQKGGSGKTTTAVNLAAALAENGTRRVLLVDCDPQGNATTWLGVDDPGRGMFAVLCEGVKVEDAIHRTTTPGVVVAPSSSWLVGAERALSGEVGAELILRRRLVELEGHYDVVLMDTPPTLGVLTIGALVAADRVLVPCEAHVMALNGLAQLMTTIEAVRDRLNEHIKVLGIVPCRVDTRTRHGAEVVNELRRRFPDETSQVVIRESVRLAEAPSFGQSILDYDPKGTGAEDYRALADELNSRLKRH